MSGNLFISYISKQLSGVDKIIRFIIYLANFQKKAMKCMQ